MTYLEITAMLERLPSGIIRARQARNLTRRAFSVLINKHEVEVRKWETGAQCPRLHSILQICDALNITFYDLFSDDLQRCKLVPYQHRSKLIEATRPYAAYSTPLEVYWPPQPYRQLMTTLHHHLNMFPTATVTIIEVY